MKTFIIFDRDPFSRYVAVAEWVAEMWEEEES